MLTEDRQAIDTKFLAFTVSPHEECAVEEAVRLVEAHGGSSARADAGSARGPRSSCATRWRSASTRHPPRDRRRGVGRRATAAAIVDAVRAQEAGGAVRPDPVRQRVGRRGRLPGRDPRRAGARPPDRHRHQGDRDRGRPRHGAPRGRRRVGGLRGPAAGRASRSRRASTCRATRRCPGRLRAKKKPVEVVEPAPPPHGVRETGRLGCRRARTRRSRSWARASTRFPRPSTAARLGVVDRWSWCWGARRRDAERPVAAGDGVGARPGRRARRAAGGGRRRGATRAPPAGRARRARRCTVAARGPGRLRAGRVGGVRGRRHGATAPAQAVLASGSDRGNEVMAHLAARLDLPLAANVTEVDAGGHVRADADPLGRQPAGGRDALTGTVKLLTVRRTRSADGGTGASSAGRRTVHARALRGGSAGPRDRREATEGGRISLGGRPGRRRRRPGGRRRRGFRSLEELAELLGGAVGVSRVVTSLGWRPHADQIGQTGQRIAPDLYIACGISGAIQHMVGCKAAKRLLAINTDPRGADPGAGRLRRHRRPARRSCPR